ncbi:MAG: hypothetical protein LLG06_00410 [Desulfobacteraceae bacterium]|nr:hypothetical protein [Desulfobacteraceae bacterium]
MAADFLIIRSGSPKGRASPSGQAFDVSSRCMAVSDMRQAIPSGIFHPARSGKKCMGKEKKFPEKSSSSGRA